MAKMNLKEHARVRTQATRTLAAQAFSRAAGAPLVHGNSIRLLKDARENYPAWLEAIPSRMRILVHQVPVRAQIDVPVQEQLIVEYYSKK